MLFDNIILINGQLIANVTICIFIIFMDIIIIAPCAEQKIWDYILHYSGHGLKDMHLKISYDILYLYCYIFVPIKYTLFLMKRYAISNQ